MWYEPLRKKKQLVSTWGIDPLVLDGHDRFIGPEEISPGNDEVADVAVGAARGGQADLDVFGLQPVVGVE